MAKIKWTDLSGLQQEFLNNLNECQKRMPEHEFIPLTALSRSKGGTRQSLVYKGLVQRAQVDYGYRYKLTDAGRALLPATEPTAAAQGEDESWGVNPTERELVAYGDGYASGLMDGPEYAPLKNEIIALQAALQQAQRERDAALATLKPFAVFGTEFIRIRVNGDDPMHSDRVTHALNDVEITVGDWQAAASTQQAANAEGGA